MAEKGMADSFLPLEFGKIRSNSVTLRKQLVTHFFLTLHSVAITTKKNIWISTLKQKDYETYL